MRGSILARAAGCALAAFSFAGLASAADIADLAPRSSYLVLSIDNWPALKGDLERSGVLGLWKEKSVRGYVDTFMRSMSDGEVNEITGYLEDIGISIDDLPPLGTTAGAAFFDGPRQDAEGRAIEGDERMTHFVVVAELNGGEAEDGRDLWQIVEEALEHAEDEGDVEVEPAHYGDGDLFRVIRRFEVEEWDEEAWENWDPDAPDADENMPAPKTVEVVEAQYVGRAGGHLVFTSSYDVARDTIDRLEGRDRGDTVGDVREFTIGRDGKAPNAHAYAVLLPQTFLRENAPDMLPMPVEGEEEAVRAVLDVLGLTGVNAISMSVEAGTPGAVVEAQFVVHVPEKRGLFSLVSGPSLRADPPSFVGPDTHSFAAYTVNFAGIIPLVRQVMNVLPDSPETDGMMMQFEQFASTVEPLLNAVGPEVTQVETLRRPFSAKSEGMVIVASMRDAEPVRNALNTLGGMAGLMPRDFAGSQIWESQFIPATVGLGAGHVFIGMNGAESVEKAMLAAAQPDAPKLADDPKYARARRALADGGVMLGWQDLRAVLEYSAWTAEHFDEVLRAQAGEFGMPEEEVEEYVEMMREHVPEVVRTPLPVDALTRVLGDVISQVRSTGRGFEARVTVLPPAR